MNKLLAAIIAVVAVCISCTSSKSKQSTFTGVDSSYIHLLESENILLKTEIYHLHSTITEMEYMGVQFDNNCDSVLRNAMLKAGCNVDSINAILSLYKSKVTSYANGMVEIEGRLKSYTRTKSRQEEIIKDQQRQIDSLAKVKSKVDVKYEKVVETKEKIVKRSWWLPFTVGAVAMLLLLILIGYMKHRYDEFRN